MTLTQETLHFILTHRTDDARSLALQARKYPAVDMPEALTQIAGWQIAQDKIPTWAAIDQIRYPAHLSLEQCSSEATARYKAQIVQKAHTHTLTDLTGGFGIDCAFLATAFLQATYVERQEELCAIARHNFPLLGLKHIDVCHQDSVEHLHAMTPVDWIFIDPARRNGHGGKTVAIADCEPDVCTLEELLLQKAKHVLVKLSPMLDLALALNDLKQVQAAYIVSAGNECKELLLLLGHGERVASEDIPVHCINLSHAQPRQSLTFTRRQEKDTACNYAIALKTYLYEPNASLLKAGAFRSLAHIYKVEKLHPNSHLYTSDQYIAHFPGRKFRITGSCGFGKNELREMLGAERKANLTVRNFPATVAELRKRLKLAEGGDTYLFATTLADERKVLIACQP